MHSLKAVLVVAVLSAQSVVQAFVIGEAPGFATGTTGGGTAEPVYPKTIEELTNFLTDGEPRVVVLDKGFDFRGTEGTTTETGCRPKSNTDCLAKNNGFAGQDVILFPDDTTLTNTGGCDQQVKIDITYDKAAKNALVIKSNKTLRGMGQMGVLTGKGLWLDGDNIIVQNIHITELNPQYVWGGDAIYIQGTEDRSMKNVWIDHVKISRVGRQMFVSGFAGVESLTISNSDFDGRTDWSSSCDGRHYWTSILDGTTTRVSLLNNYIHSTSGRSPKIIGASSDSANVVAHIANNYWADNSGHSFEPGANAFVVAEGNFIQDTAIPIQSDDPTKSSIATTDDCAPALGRACSANVVENSGTFDSLNGATALETAKQYKEITGYAPGPAAKLTKTLDNFGVGTLQDGDVSQQSEVQGDFDPSTNTTQSGKCGVRRH